MFCMNTVRSFGIATLIAATFLVGGCSTDVFKTVDQNVAGIFGETCSFTNLSSGKDFCPSKSEMFVQPPLYCYKTLGAVNCYNEENPYITEKSPRVRKVPALASTGLESISAEEYESVQAIEADTTAAD
jgi:hypothetical protein